MSEAKSRYKRAVALSYGEDFGEEAPLIAAKGHMESADVLVRIARRFNVPIVEKRELAKSLDTIEEGMSIPERLYEAVAVLFKGLSGRKFTDKFD